MKVKTKQILRGFTRRLRTPDVVAKPGFRILMASLIPAGVGVSSAVAEEGFSNARLEGAYGLNGSGRSPATPFQPQAGRFLMGAATARTAPR
jgi:hypothetical protein